jgi:hypothetical protein
MAQIECGANGPRIFAASYVLAGHEEERRGIADLSFAVSGPYNRTSDGALESARRTEMFDDIVKE